MDFSWLASPFFQHLLWEGFVNTIWLIVLSGIFGYALALALAVSQISGPRPLAWIARTITTLIRGTPLLLQLFFFYDGIGTLLAGFPQLVHDVPLLSNGFFYGFVAFTISTGAYVGEDMRGALLSVPSGQLEAAHAFGMSRFKVFRRIWLPSAIRIALPALTSEAILLLKSVPLVSTISVIDLLGAANMVRDTTFRVYGPLLLITAIYILLTLVMTVIMRLIEQNFPGRRPVGERVGLRALLSISGPPARR